MRANRQSIRLKGYEYALDGMYYVTLCTQDRRRIFGEIKADQMFRSEVGEMIHRTWLELPRYDPRISLDEFIVMPDHFHGIVRIDRFGSEFSGGQARGKILPKNRTAA